MLIEADHISIELSGRPVLRDVGLHLNEGEVYGLLGPNGAGKSTTVHVLLGLYSRSSGSVRVMEQDPELRAPAMRRQVGVLPERAGFYGWMRPEEYLQWYAALFGGARFSIPGLLERVGLADASERPIGEFSRGMRQRLGIARALLQAPKLLILDEPTNGLDPRGRREIHDLLRSLARGQNTGVLLCTHLLDDVGRLCDAVGIIHRGRTVLEGPLSEVLARKGGGRSYRVRLETEGPPENATLPTGVHARTLSKRWCLVHITAGAPTRPSRLWKYLLETGWRIVEIHDAGGGLEEVYLKCTRGDDSARVGDER
ncbi:MAG: ABC transporter ATP-binding protein [Kiritimatiellaeota bacterium]|nr:ABC transporter ATP-binding protein [Kiritimatiellota bacterium]